MIFRRRQKQPYRYWQLATYNAERARGLVHTPEWQQRMAEEKARFDREPHPAAGVVPPVPPHKTGEA